MCFLINPKMWYAERIESRVDSIRLRVNPIENINYYQFAVIINYSFLHLSIRLIRLPNGIGRLRFLHQL